VLRRRRAAGDPSVEARKASDAFRTVVDLVEEAKASLVAAVPRRRGAGAPLAEAVAGFEERLRAASYRMAPWRIDVVRAEWDACSEALRESLRRAEALRLTGSPTGYEELAPALAGLMEPLEAFEAALRRFRQAGV
jgi:hypothetical protein